MDRFFGPVNFANHTRGKRYAIEGSFWGVKTITYRIARASSSLTFEQQKEVFRRAFSVWEEHTQLRFVYKEEGDVHIDIIFTTGAHGDGEPFDGRGRILAHAYFPRYGGDFHFDDDELWSMDKYGPGLDLYAVAVHEAGHALGLKHSHEQNAIMAPFYQTYTGRKLHLHTDDLLALDRLYGPSGAANRDQPITKQNLEILPDMCRKPHLDAITRLQNGTIYAFQGRHFWELGPSGPLPDNPKKIKDFWGIDGPFDAAMTNIRGNVYVFKGRNYYVFTSNALLLPGYPRKIEEGLKDTPNHINAAMTWNYDDKPYLFKKDKYWKYSRFGMPRTWPRTITKLFRGKVPSHIDAAFRLDNNSSFIFSGQNYWKIGGFRYMKVLRGYPKSIANYWFNCD